MKLDRTVDIKQKLRDVKKFLKKRNNNKAKRELEAQEASSLQMKRQKSRIANGLDQTK